MAFAKFLNTIRLFLGEVWLVVTLAHRERRNLLVHIEVPANVAGQVLDHGKRPHRAHRYGFTFRILVQTIHAHQLRFAIHLTAAGTAFAGLTIPADGKIGGMDRLHGVDSVQHNHPGCYGNGVVHHFALLVTPIDAERYILFHLVALQNRAQFRWEVRQRFLHDLHPTVGLSN